MTRMTIAVDDDVRCWVKVKAAQQGTSVSRLVGDMLRDQMRKDDAYQEAMEAYLSTPPRRLTETGEYPVREARIRIPGPLTPP